VNRQRDLTEEKGGDLIKRYRLRMAGHKNIAKATRLMGNKPHLALAMLKL
jgi:hypothetical protein